MKRLMICLLLLGIAGCGSDADKQITDTPTTPTEADKKTTDRPTAPTDAGKRTTDPHARDAETEFNKGLEFEKREDWTTAIGCYTEAIRINPDYAKGYAARGKLYSVNGDKAKAEADRAKAKELGSKPDE